MSQPLASLATRHHTRAVWRQSMACRVAEPTRSGVLAGWWQPAPRHWLPQSLAEALDSARAAGEIVKPGRRIELHRADLDGREVLIKTYHLPTTGLRLRYLGRMSRGRRAFLAGMAMKALGLPAPEPLGYLEELSGGIPYRSSVVMEWVPDAVTVRHWIKPRLHLQPAEARERVGEELAELLLGLYRQGVYHGDTKAGNILVQNPYDPARRSYSWIDLECMRFGWPIARRDVLRNLAQLNGSVGRKLPDQDRLAFLARLARELPWLGQPRIAESVRRMTRRRLLRELHDGVTP